MELYFTQIGKLSEAISAKVVSKGWLPVHRPFRKVELAQADPSLSWENYDLVVLSSKHAIRWLLHHAVPQGLPIAVVGNASNAYIPEKQRFFSHDAPPNAEALAKALVKQLQPGTRVLLLLGEQARPTLAEALGHFQLEIRVVYQTTLFKGDFARLKQPSMVYFQAPSAVEDFHRHMSEAPSFCAAIGPSTAEKIKTLGWPIHFQPSRPELAVFADELPPANAFERKQKNGNH